MNTDDLNEVLQELAERKPVKKYPLCLMIPPISRGSFDAADSWERYKVTMFFLSTTYYDGNNQVSNQNKGTGTSMHTIPQTWQEMKRAAVNFIRVLDKLQRIPGPSRPFSLIKEQRTIEPLSLIGGDRASGVRLDFDCSLYIGCDLEDYTEAGIKLITIPTI